MKKMFLISIILALFCGVAFGQMPENDTAVYELINMKSYQLEFSGYEAYAFFYSVFPNQNKGVVELSFDIQIDAHTSHRYYESFSYSIKNETISIAGFDFIVSPSGKRVFQIDKNGLKLDENL